MPKITVNLPHTWSAEYNRNRIKETGRTRYYNRGRYTLLTVSGPTGRIELHIQRIRKGAGYHCKGCSDLIPSRFFALRIITRDVEGNHLDLDSYYHITCSLGHTVSEILRFLDDHPDQLVTEKLLGAEDPRDWVV